MTQPNKFYVVWKGANPGIYESWADCQTAIGECPYPRFKSFLNKDRATLAFRLGRDPGWLHSKIKPITPCIVVDASSEGNPGAVEYQGLELKPDGQKEKIFHTDGLFGTSNIGEFLAIVEALKYRAKSEIPIYSDSKVAIAGIAKGYINSSLVENEQTKITWSLLRKGILELAAFEISRSNLHFWDKREWGENPADFGKKNRSFKTESLRVQRTCINA